MTCTGCGAKLPLNMDTCNLCGTSINETVGANAAPLLQEAKAILTPHNCAACGAENKAGANFCFHCGADLRLQETNTPTPVKIENVADNAVAKQQVFKVLGIGAFAVIALFGITLWSKENFKPAPKAEDKPQTQAANIQEVPVTPELEEKAKPLVDKIAKLSGDAKIVAQTDLAKLYLQNQRQDKAGTVQEAIAMVKNDAESWAVVGHSFYDWMMMQPDGDAQKAAYAQKAVAAYEKSLKIKENPDVRTDMAVAYLNDPLNPMKAIENTNLVLEKNPNHIQANFNKGFMLMQVGRSPQAKEFFQKVKTLTPATDEAHKRADMMLQELAKSVKQ